MTKSYNTDLRVVDNVTVVLRAVCLAWLLGKESPVNHRLINGDNKGWNYKLKKYYNYFIKVPVEAVNARVHMLTTLSHHIREGFITAGSHPDALVVELYIVCQEI